MNVESTEFESKIKKILFQLDRNKFDIINISMVLLHLKNPGKLLKRLHGFLSEDGIIIIRDIDDGINFAYPDPNMFFERIYKICDQIEQSGTRKTGRQIFTLLTRAGFTDIKLEKQGLSTIGLSELQRESLFNLYFPFILSSSKMLTDSNPNDYEIKEDFAWLEKNFDKIRKTFMDAEFVFSLGMMLYSARS